MLNRLLTSALVAGVGFIPAAFCEGDSPYFPPADAAWETISPADAGFDADGLEAVAAYAKAANSSGLVVLLNGRILLERHWKIEPDSPDSSGAYQRMLQGYTEDGHAIEDVASVQKSVTSFLAGMAVSADKLSLDDPVSVYLDEGWSNATPDQERAITIKHLMSMTSGLSEGLAYKRAPGIEWKYNTGAYSQMVAVLESIYSKPIEELTTEKLTKPAGMANSHWKTRGRPGSTNNMGFTTTARDLARFGMVILANGAWDGKPLGVSDEYMHAMLTASQTLNPNYGLLWWLNGRPPNLKPGEQYRSIPNAPDDVVAALGALGRKVHVSRKTGLVLVRIGNQHPREFDMEVWGLVMKAKMD